MSKDIRNNLVRARDILAGSHLTKEPMVKLHDITRAAALALEAFTWWLDQEDHWQNIGTAPRDGTLVLVRGRSGYRTHPWYIVAAWWTDGAWRGVDGERLSDDWAAAPLEWRRIT